jgi:predicted TIM-barrel fold metal-dependent hydrolase
MSIAALLLPLGVIHCAQRPPLPVIDMHMHAQAADFNGPPPLAVCAPFPDIMPRDVREDYSAAFLAMQKKPPCTDPVWSPTTDDGVMNATLEVLRRRNIIGVLSSAENTMDRVLKWRDAAPDRIIPALGFNLGASSPTPAMIARLHQQGQFVVFGEVGIQYQGYSPSDDAFEPFLAMAEQRDIPVGIHIGTGPSGAPYLDAPQYRARLHSPLILEEALIRHPKLRVYIMHAGWPMLDDLLAVLWVHPQVYVDVAVIDWALPRAEFHRYLQRIVEAGFGRRVMFGSDQMTWPGVIEPALQAVESAPFLNDTQKRNILYNNAARFLRLSEAQIAGHHGAEPTGGPPIETRR